MQFTIVGKIISTHGIKGELKVFPLTDDINRFKDLKEAYIGEEKLKVQVVGVKFNKDKPIIRFKEFDNINQVLKFKDLYLYVDDENLIQLEENEYFVFQLLGCEVEDIEGKSIGILEDIISTPSNDVYVIRHGDKEYLVPAIKEFVKDIDINSKLIRIDPIEGMIE